MATPNDPRLEANSAVATASAGRNAELALEIQRAIDEIERRDSIVLSLEDVDRWAETGVPPWPEESSG